jgi:hypothetical protein
MSAANRQPEVKHSRSIPAEKMKVFVRILSRQCGVQWSGGHAYSRSKPYLWLHIIMPEKSYGPICCLRSLAIDDRMWSHGGVYFELCVQIGERLLCCRTSSRLWSSLRSLFVCGKFDTSLNGLVESRIMEHVAKMDFSALKNGG